MGGDEHMRMMIKHKVDGQLVLPLSYHHIIQGIIYHNLRDEDNYSAKLHDQGYEYGERQYRLFSYSLLDGKYRIDKENKKIIFYDQVSFCVTSPEVRFIRGLADNLISKGIDYGSTHIDDVQIYISDFAVESEQLIINMLSPISVNITDETTGKTYFFTPDEAGFMEAVNDNFHRKYISYYGINPDSDIHIEPYNVSPRDKYVTRYKDFIVSGWKGQYVLTGKRKYLDFLFQTGIGARNSQGFGMFEIKEEM